jgi:KUP system potassium uptake protein
MLSLAALGVVFGDIGTSPLYALQACFTLSYGLKPDQVEVMGILSLIFWALFLVITGKYLTVLMRLDSRGEGGICAMYELIRHERLSRRWKTIAIAITIVGTALLFGDGMITPAISVLSALGGLSEHSEAAGRFAMPLAVVVLVVLFGIQRFGAGKMGMLFGPIMLVWFIVIGVFGLLAIIKAPDVLLAVDPRHAVWFVQRHAGTAFVVLGAVVLVVTGGEALYADMGHFGRRAIRIAWVVVVWPSLLLCYFGQGANLMAEPTAIGNPFFSIVPEVMLWPMIILSTFAAVIASQAIISGIFSLTRQAANLSFFPPHKVVHTSRERIGQI